MELVENLSFKQAGAKLHEETDTTGKKFWYLKGIFIEGDVKNRNNRIYPSSEIRSAVEQLNEKISSGETVYGELDHPSELQIALQKSSHFIQEIHMDGKNGVGTMKIMNTPMGQIAQAMLEAGGSLGVSSRGSGEVEYNGHVSSFEINTIDLVCTNSAPNARPQAVHEAYNGIGGGRREDLINAVAHDPKAQKYLV